MALIGFSYGATPIIGAHYGRKDDDKVGASFKDSIYANILCGALVILIYTLLYFNLHNLGQPEELLPVMRPYFLAYLFTMPFIVMFNSLKQFTDTVAATKTAMWAIIIGNVTNIILNYLLIYGVCGFPRMGLTGAGIATLISRIVMIVIMYILIKQQKRFSIYSKGFREHSTRNTNFPCAPERVILPWAADSRTDGHGDSLVLARLAAYGMVGCNRTCSISGDVHNRLVMFPYILWNRSSSKHQNKPLQRTWRLDKSA